MVQSVEEQMQIITSSASVSTVQLGAADGLSIRITGDNWNQAKRHRAGASELGLPASSELPGKGLRMEEQPSY